MKRGFQDILVGVIVFVGITLVISFLTSIRLIIPDAIVNLLNDSPNPPLALYAFGALASALLLAMLRLGLVIPKLKAFVPDEAMRYLAGLPLWLVVILVIVSALSLFLVYPTCRTPGSIIFEIPGQGTIRPTDMLLVKPGQTLLIQARPVEQDYRLHCKWQYVGNAFQMLGALEGCDVDIEFSPKPGDGFLTLVASYDFCTQNAVFSIPVKVQAP
jgi:hypothetical protein